MKQALRSGLKELAGLPRAAIVCGLMLVLIPTLFTVVPELAEQLHVAVRGLVVLLWASLALIVVVATTRQGVLVDELADKRRARRGAQSELAARVLLQTLLRHHGFPGHYQFRLFFYDEEQRKLVPAYDPNGAAASTGWKPGQGVTGMAYQTGNYQQARGTGLTEARWGLTPAQKQRYAAMAVVAAVPIKDDDDRLLAVLTGSSEKDDGQLVSSGGQNKHRALSEVAARVLLDVIRSSD